jgi:hypothetical protein
MANPRLSSGVRSFVFATAALWCTGCSSSDGGAPSDGSAAGTGIAGSAAAGSTGSSGSANGGSANSGSANGGSANGGSAAGSGGFGHDGGAGAGSTAGNGAGGGGTGSGGTSTNGGAAGGPGGNGGAAGAGGNAGGSDPGGACQKGQTAADEVLIIGDSYFPAAGGEIVKELRRLSGANYRDRSVPGAKMNAIVTQYDNAGAPQPKVVIMDGGGNDILQNPGCMPGCAQEVQAVTEAKNFFEQLAKDGVKDVVFIFYYDMPVMKAGLDWMRPKMAAECQQSPVPCHFVDNQPLFAGMDASTYTTDGIHPNAAAADKIAKQVWDRMQQDCVAP